jgi:uncharacterized membrane protein (UPF0182 family)
MRRRVHTRDLVLTPSEEGRVGSLPASQTLDDVIVRIRKSYSNPNVRTINQVVLKEGPRAFRIATLLELINPTTKAFHQAVVSDFPKTRLIDGPLQIEARIDQNAQLSGQVTLWNQQGSRVRRGSLAVRS